MTDELEVDLQDAELISEITLVTDLIVAATESVGPMSQETIDRLLGIVAVHPTDVAAPFRDAV